MNQSLDRIKSDGITPERRSNPERGGNILLPLLVFVSCVLVTNTEPRPAFADPVQIQTEYTSVVDLWGSGEIIQDDLFTSAHNLPRALAREMIANNQARCLSDPIEKIIRGVEVIECPLQVDLDNLPGEISVLVRQNTVEPLFNSTLYSLDMNPASFFARDGYNSLMVGLDSIFDTVRYGSSGTVIKYLGPDSQPYVVGIFLGESVLTFGSGGQEDAVRLYMPSQGANQDWEIGYITRSGEVYFVD